MRTYCLVNALLDFCDSRGIAVSAGKLLFVTHQGAGKFRSPSPALSQQDQLRNPIRTTPNNCVLLILLAERPCPFQIKPRDQKACLCWPVTRWVPPGTGYTAQSPSTELCRKSSLKPPIGLLIDRATKWVTGCDEGTAFDPETAVKRHQIDIASTDPENHGAIAKDQIFGFQIGLNGSKVDHRVRHSTVPQREWTAQAAR